ncbi:MAG: glycosyl hydrolase family 28 protein [Paludibacter sp.]|nr:glycosyl hydrolase family 28 protein [Paludibacter sp.]
MKIRKISYIVILILLGFQINLELYAQDTFPDGSHIPAWFSQFKPTDISNLGKKYIITDYGVKIDSNTVQTKQIQSIIDNAAKNGGGVIIVPKGTFLSGSLFFKQNTHLFLEKDAVLKGSDDIADFRIVPTRIEGQTLNYFAALVNADSIDGFTISGRGTINGNGHRYWRAFWLRRKWNPKCTNMDEQRPRLLYVSNCKNITISGVKLINSPFWTSHYYKCESLKILGVYIYAPNKKTGTPSPSSDGIDLDVCSNVLIKNCYISVNDDGICLKGGKGPNADKDSNNGCNKNIIIEDNTIDECPALTLGSESVHTYNVIFRRCNLKNAHNLLLLKMRPDTPQRHEYILVEDITGSSRVFLNISPWTQFFDLKGQTQPKSTASSIVMRNCKVECNTFISVKSSTQYQLKDFTFENLEIIAKNGSFDKTLIQNCKWKDIKVNSSKINSPVSLISEVSHQKLNVN